MVRIPLARLPAASSSSQTAAAGCSGWLAASLQADLNKVTHRILIKINVILCHMSPNPHPEGDTIYENYNLSFVVKHRQWNGHLRGPLCFCFHSVLLSSPRRFLLLNLAICLRGSRADTQKALGICCARFCFAKQAYVCQKAPHFASPRVTWTPGRGKGLGFHIILFTFLFTMKLQL